MKFNLELTLLLICALTSTTVLCAPVAQKLTNSRKGKSVGYFDYIQSEPDFGNYVDSNDYDVSLAIEQDDLSRTIPRRRIKPQYNSPIYYIRLPPQPYMYVPGLGYVSQPAPPPMSQFLNLPINFVSNGKPNGIYQWTGGLEIPSVAPPINVPAPIPTTPKPKPKPFNKPDSTIHRIPGQFVFNGRPNDEIFVLRDSYNQLYGDVLQNLYP